LKNKIIPLSYARFRAFATGDRAALRDMIADDAVFMYRRS
jgi:ketosteroid isomerase-like protein